jgi:hypothetical protein
MLIQFPNPMTQAIRPVEAAVGVMIIGKVRP